MNDQSFINFILSNLIMDMKANDKLTHDINKFINNKDKIKNLLGECKIKRWVLMAPVCNDRRLI